MKLNIFSISILLCSNLFFAQIKYPITIKKPIIDKYHGLEVIDNYRWLEKQDQDSVKKWIENQNKISEKYLKKLSRSNNVSEQMNKFMFSDMGNYDGKVKNENKNEYYFRLFYTGYNSTASLFYKKKNDKSYNTLVDASLLSKKDQVNISNYWVSKNKTLLAYEYNRNGSDWHEIRTVKIDKKRHYQNVLKHTRGEGVEWLNDGFFYKKYPFDSIKANYKQPYIMYHKVGTKQVDDKVMFKSFSENEDIRIIGDQDESFYIIQRENSFKGLNSYYFLNPTIEKEKMGFRPFLINSKFNLNFRKYKDSTFYVTTEIKGKRQLVSINKNEPLKFNLLSPTYKELELLHIEFLEKFIVFSYNSLDGSILTKVDYQGNLIKECVLPSGLFVKGLNYSKAFDEFFFYLGSYTIPTVLYKLDLESFKYELVEETEVNFDFKGYKFKQDSYTSHDGVKVPIFIVYKDSLKKDGSTPFLLKTYGGYGVTEMPSYNPGIVFFLESGGAFAYTHIRGSGGFGKSWWDEGKGLKKKNGINDFISAAEYLINEGHTSPKKIAITGTSHGGLITGAALAKRPDLFGSAVINVGALDMLRAEKFTVGSARTNIKEYGTVKDSLQFKNLLSYSPYHNIDDSINYPSILIKTGNYDNRVPPLHSYKFAARLQNNPSQVNPVILWTQENTGHFGANNINDNLQENVFVYSFLYHQLE